LERWHLAAAGMGLLSGQVNRIDGSVHLRRDQLAVDPDLQLM
jgi:hypothetical protein